VALCREAKGRRLGEADCNAASARAGGDEGRCAAVGGDVQEAKPRSSQGYVKLEMDGGRVQAIWPRACKAAWRRSAVCASRRGAQSCQGIVRVRCCNLSCSDLVSIAHLYWRVRGVGKDTRWSSWAHTC
jgi:hypothetical protein